MTHPPDGADTPGRPLPPQLTMGLLDYVASTALDADYAVVAERRAAEAGDEDTLDHRPRGRRAGTVVVLLAFALLLSVAALQTARSESTREAGRQSLVDQVDERRDRLDVARSRVTDLRREVAALQRTQLSGSEQGRALRERLSVLGADVGARPVTGPGMVVTVDDAPGARSDRQRVLDGDLQRLVNGLWQAGAEAVSINGQRLTQLSAIRTAGEAIHVNFKPLRRPYDGLGHRQSRPDARAVHRNAGWGVVVESEVRLQREVRDEFEGGAHAARRAPGRPAARARPEDRAVIAVLGLVLGVVLGLLIQPDVPFWLEPYLPIAVVAALDAVFGGLRAFLDGIFDDKVFIVSFVSNVLIAGLIVYLGDQLGVGGQLSTGVVVVLGIRIFSNVAAIRRHLFHA